MGKGIDLARDTNPLHAALLDDLKDQLLIVFLKRMGGSVKIPVAEIDDTYQDMMAMSVGEDRVFHFEIKKKN